MVRGIRNNNPGNIRHSSSNWLGLTPRQLDKEFCTFSEMKYGCRALLKLLITYTTKYNCKTVESIINKYAPSTENNTNAYVHSVCQYLKCSSTDCLDFSKNRTYLNLAKAIVRHECGKDASYVLDTDWEQAFKLVFN